MSAAHTTIAESCALSQPGKNNASSVRGCRFYGDATRRFSCQNLKNQFRTGMHSVWAERCGARRGTSREGEGGIMIRSRSAVEKRGCGGLPAGTLFPDCETPRAGLILRGRGTLLRGSAAGGGDRLVAVHSRRRRALRRANLVQSN